MPCRANGRQGLLRIGVAAAFFITGSAEAADDVHIWIRAFVPDGVSGFEFLAEPLASAPGTYFVRASDGGCLATDRRSWTEVINAPSRLRTELHLVIDDSQAAVVKPATRATSTAAINSIDCSSGAVLATTPSQLVADEVSTPSQAQTTTQLSVLAATANVQRSWSSSTIHYDVSFNYDSQSHTLYYQASTGIFPAYEAYASLNDGPVVTIFRSVPARHADGSATGAAKAEQSASLRGSVNLSGIKRPKAPTGLTVQ